MAGRASCEENELPGTDPIDENDEADEYPNEWGVATVGRKVKGVVRSVRVRHGGRYFLAVERTEVGREGTSKAKSVGDELVDTRAATACRR